MIEETSMLTKVIQVLKEYALCDRCLGRLYARKGLSLDNKLRGIAIKTLLTMYAREIAESVSKGELASITKNIMFRPFIETLAKQGLLEEKVLEDQDNIKCYVCGDNLDEILNLYFNKVQEVLKDYEVERFVVGVKVPHDIIKREEELIRRYKFEQAESIKNEIKREIGKRLLEFSNLKVDFENPQIVILIDLGRKTVHVEVKPLLIRGRYLKLGRNISQSKWITRYGIPRTDISIAGILETLCGLTNASELKIHAAGREDLDVRMIGSGRPLIIELKNPIKRKIDLKRLEDHVNKQSEFIKIMLEYETSRKDVTNLKMKAKYQKKIYRALIASYEPITKDNLVALENVMRQMKIKQRTPLRVLHRRKDITRIRMVYRVKCILLHENLFESIIECQGGLYVKELIEGDEGRTQPSFSSILNRKLKCLELDVLAVY